MSDEKAKNKNRKRLSTPIEPESAEADATRALEGFPPPPTEDLPDSIGSYRILGKLGEGGMGVVYEAEQKNPRRRVALKIVRGGEFLDDARLRLFQREVDTLARLDHPDIGRIYESGRTAGGQHFFAMELVRGETLDRFLEKRRDTITPAELHLRLALFRRIAGAVHYAHQRGVIHRDLKPSNVVVMDADEDRSDASFQGSTVPGIKILDFGLARITDGDVAATSMVSEVGVIKGTLPYMSPEQTRGDPTEIDIRTDVYALGVILYEMLAAKRPYEVENRPLVEAVRVICEESAAPLKRIWSGTGRLDPDIETIVGKALEKDPDRRYESAAALSEDVNRYLTSQPILARPPSTAYQLRKFTARNRTLVGGVAATIVVLVAGVVVSVTLGLREAAQRREAERARSDLESVVDFQAGMLDQVDPEQMGIWLAQDLQERVEAATRERELSDLEISTFLDSYDATMRRVNTTSTAVDVIDRNILAPALAAIEERFEAQPVIDARLRQTIGRAYFGLGRYGQSKPQLQEAFETYKGVLGADHPRTLGSMHNLARLYVELDRYDDAEALLLKTLTTRKRVFGNEHPQTLSSMNLLGTLYWVQGRFDEGGPLLARTLAARKRVLGEEHAETLATMNLLANLYAMQGRNDEAESLYVQALEGRKRVLGADHPATLASLGNVATLYADQGRYEEAEPILLDLLQIQKSKYGDDHPRTLQAMYHVANVYVAEDRHDEAEPLFVEALDGIKRVLGEDSSYALALADGLASLYQSRGRYAEAESLFVEILATQKRMYGPDHWATPRAMFSLGRLYRIQERHGEAEPLYREALEAQRRIYGDENPETLRFMEELAGLYVTTDRPDLARPLVSELLSMRRRAAEAGDADAKMEYARLLLNCKPADLRDPETGLRYALEASELTKHENPRHLYTLSVAYHRTGDREKAIATLQEAIAVLPAGASAERTEFEQALSELNDVTPAAGDR